jgi:hypothetical protein
MTDLTALARAAHRENELLRAEQEVADKEDHRQVVLAAASAFAVKVLGDAAEGLVFEWATAKNPNDVAADAALPGSSCDVHLSYEYSDADETSRLSFVRFCGHCGHVAVDEIRSLAHLGDLLTD